MRFAAVIASIAAAAITLSACHKQEQATAAATPVKLVHKAVCGAGDRPESVQGEVTLAERFAPGAKAAFKCNLELVGQYVGEGSSFSSTVYDHCAYYSTWISPRLEHPGVTVLDVSDPHQPKATAWLDDPGMLYANESLQADAKQKILVGAGAWDSTAFYAYDLSQDCAHPKLISATSLPATLIHYGRFGPDGKLFYGAIWTGAETPEGYYASPKYRPGDPPPSAFYVIDMANPAKPRTIATWVPKDKTWLSHSATVSADGNRAYVTMLRELDDQLKSPNVNGLVILDISDFQARKTNPQVRVVGTDFWDDSHYAQFAYPVTVKGKPYIVFTDASGSIGAGKWGHEADDKVPDNSCDSGKPSHGFARLIDISDEKHPKTVSRLILEVSDPKRCRDVMLDPAMGYKYGTEACSTDNDGDAHILACAQFEGGIRVFDIRNPAAPREIAYYKPPAVGNAFRAANPEQTQGMVAPGDPRGAKAGRTADMTIRPNFHRANGELQIWFNSLDNGFQVLRFTDDFRKREKALFDEVDGSQAKLAQR
jgi:hypothetical protein